MKYETNDYLLIRDDEVIAVSGNTEFYEDFDIEYQNQDTIVKVIDTATHNMTREERDKLKDERDNPHGKTYELSVSDCECQGCPPKIGECDCRDSLPLIPEYNCHNEIDKLKEERDELDKICMSQQVEIDRLNTKICLCDDSHIYPCICSDDTIPFKTIGIVN